MAQIILEVKDAYLAGIGEKFGNRNDPAEAIRAKYQQEVDSYTTQVIKEEDPEVITKKQELEQLIAQKEAEIKGK